MLKTSILHGRKRASIPLKSEIQVNSIGKTTQFLKVSISVFTHIIVRKSDITHAIARMAAFLERAAEFAA